jgi:indolepyruvate ferredoxin oxidoreductase alpha subunit
MRSPEGNIAVLIAGHPCIVNRAALQTQAVFAMSITDDCVGCRACIDTFECPAILFDEEENRAGIDQNRCIGCGVCVHVCPAGAIRAEGEKP